MIYVSVVVYYFFFLPTYFFDYYDVNVIFYDIMIKTSDFRGGMPNQVVFI